MSRRQSLGRQIAFRVSLALLLSTVLAGAFGIWFFYTSERHNSAVEVERAKRRYVNLISELEQRWGREAYNFRVRLEFSKLLMDPKLRQSRVKAFMTAQGGGIEFPILQIKSPSGETLVEHGYAKIELPANTLVEGDETGWSYDPRRKALFFIVRQTIWMGDGNATLLLFKPIDHAFVTREAYPDSRLSIWWDGQPVASSIGIDGLALAATSLRKLEPGLAQAQFLPWVEGGDRSTPHLFIEMQTHQGFPRAQMALPMFFGVLFFALAAWIILGRWLVRTLQRIGALEHAQSVFLIQRNLSPEVDAELNSGHGDTDDEIATLATSLRYLMRNTVDYEHEQQAAMRKMTEHHQTHLAILETTRDGFWTLDLDGRILDVNPGYLAISGYSRDDLMAMRVHDLEAIEAPEVVDAHMQKIVVSRHELFETVHRRKDGSIWHVEVSASFSTTGGGRFFAFLRDITERKQVESDLRIAATTFEAQEGIIITDPEGKILRVNRTFCEITGYSADEAIGQTPKLLNSGRHDADFYRQMWAAVDKTGVWQGEIWNRRKSGEIYIERLTITAVRDSAGRTTHFVGTFADITQSKQAADEIRNLAFYDPLTALPNRRLLLDRLQRAITTSARDQKHGALLLFDLDDFKTLNDTLGHDVGDQFLIQVANRLSNSVRQSDTVARLGGDEFVVILENLDPGPMAALQVESVAIKIQVALSKAYELEVRTEGHAHRKRSYRCTSSIGVTLFLGSDLSSDELIKRADTAMYQAKAAGRDALRFFDPEMQASLAMRAALDADLRIALEEQQFLLHYQPQIDEQGRLTGAEALIRWEHPQRGIVSPIEFIPLAEETGLILPLGNWVLETACAQLAAWAQHPELAHITLAVNVSARQFSDPNFVERVEDILRTSQANPKRLKLELTESMLISDVDSIIDIMTALQGHGISFSLDDFGTGYSSLAYIKRLPLDQLKIDRSFVRDVLDDDNDAAIACAIIVLANSLKLSVIAEGVETLSQRDFLAAAGCSAYQGYYFSRPLPLAAFEKFARQGQPA